MVDVAMGAVERLSGGLLVVITPTGVHVPKYDHEAPIELHLTSLAFLCELAASPRAGVPTVIARMVDRMGAPEDQLVELADQLRVRRLIVPLDPVTYRDAPLPDVRRAETPPAVTADTPLSLIMPAVFRVTRRGLERLDHDGHVRRCLTPRELLASTAFRNAATLHEAHGRHTDAMGSLALSTAEFAALAFDLLDAGLLRILDPAAGHRTLVGDRHVNEMSNVIEGVMAAGARALAEHQDAERAREAETGRRRTKVMPVHSSLEGLAPLSLGMVLAYAMSHGGGALLEDYDFYHPGWFPFLDGWPDRPEARAFADEPAVFLFSNYVWSSSIHLRWSAEAKALSPNSIMIHGGPDTPRYAGDVETFFRKHPHVDVAVHGEGEVTLAELLDALRSARQDDGSMDLSVLADVRGLTFRNGDEIVRTADRDRITDLNIVPSPFLAGIFDCYESISASAIIETNRGCPYGCTFCDWGSATLSRIRQFSLDRVLAELEWCASHGVKQIMLADANFGILERDVEIARRISELRKEYGFPLGLDTNYAKNTVKHLKQIVQLMADAGILTEGLLSLQSMDPGTLGIIKRSNIKLEKYEDLAREFRKANLPLYVDLMIGLPGATLTSFQSDLQQCVDREITTKIFPTEVLVNSPMNEPSYRAEHQILTLEAAEAGKVHTMSANNRGNRQLVVSTATFTRDDYEKMLDMRRFFLVSENYGVLRQVSRHVRQVVGLKEVDLYVQLLADATADPDRWPTLAFLARAMPQVMAPPASWRIFIDELREYLVMVVGVPADTALETVLLVQHALLPAPGRSMPSKVDLLHDYAAWHAAMVDAKDAGHLHDWQDEIPCLRDLPPATFMVEDPNDVCGAGLGFDLELEPYGNWEMVSPTGRALPSKHLVSA